MSGHSFPELPQGYPQLAALAGRDKSFAIFRRFRTLNVRNLLYLQSELIDLEFQLSDVDARLHETELRTWTNFAADSKRKELFRKIRSKLSQYNETLLRYERVANLESPSNGVTKALKDWVDYAQPISDSGCLYLEDNELRSSWIRKSRFTFEREPRELVTLDQDNASPLGRLIKRSVGLFFVEDLIIYGDEEPRRAIWFYPTSKVENVVRLTAVLIVALLANLSIVVLSKVAHQLARLGLITLFTILIAFFLAICGAKETEIINGTIAFAAVLIVFISTDD